MFTRPLVGVQTGQAGAKVEQHVSLPAVFSVAVRPDLVNTVHSKLIRNKQQPYAVSKYAGHQTSAESWGTGRAVARIPRVSGGGTHRAGQGAFGNMCRGGRRFAPTKTWRRWHRMVNVNEKRFAVASAIAASAIPALVMARGHKISQVPEVPLVVDNKAIDNVDKTSKAIALLKAVNAFEDVQKSKNSTSIRSGKGKMRNRRYVTRRGPLVVFNEKTPLVKAFRNLPGVDLVSVNRLNLLQLAPGGHLGRFIVWTRDAFEKLDAVFGTQTKGSQQKKGYKLPRNIVTNADFFRIANSDEVQSALRVTKETPRHERKRNPLKNMKVLAKLNPSGLAEKRRVILANEKRAKAKADLIERKRKGEKIAPSADRKTKKATQKRLRPAKKAFVSTLFAK